MSGFFIHSSVDGHLVPFYVLAVVNSISVNMEVLTPLISILLDNDPEVGWLGRRVVLFFVVAGPPYCFPQWWHQFMFPWTVC